MRVEDCFEKRLLRKIDPDIKKARKSLEIARKKLTEGRNAFDSGLFSSCIVMAYTAMFHAARAILYRDGVQEKSHVCVILYLKAKYSRELSTYLINALDVHRIERHETLYGIEFIPTEDDCESIMEDAEEFIKKVEKILSSKLNRARRFKKVEKR